MTRAAVEGVEDGVNAAADVDEKQASWRGKVSTEKAGVVLTSRPYLPCDVFPLSDVFRGLNLVDLILGPKADRASCKKERRGRL
jgi:hypothetical protein